MAHNCWILSVVDLVLISETSVIKPIADPTELRNSAQEDRR